jgi:hypothetical protein
LRNAPANNINEVVFSSTRIAMVILNKKEKLQQSHCDTSNDKEKLEDNRDVLYSRKGRPMSNVAHAVTDDDQT